jgi:hypothetical protein
MGMRDVIAAIADKRIDTLRPQTSYAVVQSINREQRSAQVLYMGDTDAVTVALGSIEPATVGQTVRIGGTLGHRYVEDVLGNAIMSGNVAPSRLPSTTCLTSTLRPTRRGQARSSAGTTSAASGRRSRSTSVLSTCP